MGALAKKIEGILPALERLGAAKATDNVRSIRFSGGAPAVERVEGKGLGFARAVRAKAYAHLEGIPVMEACDRLDQLTGVKYGDSVKGTVKALAEGTVGTGGVFSPDEFSTDFIEILRPKLALIRAGIRVIPMSRQSLTRGRQATAAALTWKGENQAITYSQPSFDAPQLNLKDAAIMAAISNDLLRDQAVSADVIVRDDLVKVAMLGIDLAGIRGSGSQFTPKGVRNWIPASNVVGSSAAAGTPTLQTAAYDIEAKLTGQLNNLNVPDEHRVLLMHPRTVAGFKQLKDGVGGFPIGREINENGTIFGLPYFPTTQIPINLSGGGSGGSLESEIYCLEAPEVEMGQGLQPTVEISREASYVDASQTMQSLFTNDQTGIRMVLRVDFIMRHNNSAAVVNGCTYGA